ncbi:MAG TPA: Shedu anti-phage system protein SduA domain-containing protein [bacterium]|nr:Shedu anti-phage system protein SduA domain-containing protein [bacterium]
MKLIKKPGSGIRSISKVLRDSPKVISKAVFFDIPHNTTQGDVRLMVGRFDKKSGQPVSSAPKTKMTFYTDEFNELLTFISDNYEPFKAGVRNYIPINSKFDPNSLVHLRAVLNDPDKRKVLSLIDEWDLVPEDVARGLEFRNRSKAVEAFERMVNDASREHDWQVWFTRNDWVLGSEFVRILDDRRIDTENVADFLMQAYDGFVDIIEIKKPAPDLPFWRERSADVHPVPSSKLTEAITQSARYIHEVERRVNDLQFFKKHSEVKAVKPRCVLIFGRSDDWGDEQREAYRILNSSYHNLTILTYDHVLARARRILEPAAERELTKSELDDIPF